MYTLMGVMFLNLYKKKKGKDCTICLQNLSRCNLKNLKRSPTLIWPQKTDPSRGKGNKIKMHTT